MLLLFTSYVCDTCNPPKGQVAQDKEKAEPTGEGWRRLADVADTPNYSFYMRGARCDYHLQRRIHPCPAATHLYFKVSPRSGTPQWVTLDYKHEGRIYPLSALCDECYDECFASGKEE